MGAFRSIVPEGGDTPFGSQGGFVDALAPRPYSLATAYLQAWAEADPAVAARWIIERLDLAEPLEVEDRREEVRLRDADLAAMAAGAPDLIALSAYCWNDHALREVTAALAEALPGVVLVLGGRAAEGDPAETLREHPALDAVVTGEGERPFAEILRRVADGRALVGIPGVSCRVGDSIHHGGPSECVARLDDIPSPLLTGVLDPPLHGAMIELSRGCLNRCGYCTWSADKRLRGFGRERVEAEVRWLVERGHRHVVVNDAALNSDPRHLETVVEAITAADPGGQIAWTYNVRHDLLDEGQLRALSRLPTHMALLGVETLARAPMAEVDRAPVDVGALRERLESLARATRPPVVSIVLGLPGDDLEGFLQTLDTLLAWTTPAAPGRPPAVGTVLVSLLQVYRGSGLWRRREELGLRVNEPGIPYLLESRDWPRERLAAAKAALLERLAEDPERLKAAEALVFAERDGGVDPWLTTRRVAALLAPWRPGERRGAWTLESMGLRRDTALAVSLRFRDEGGARVRLSLARRGGGPRRPSQSRLYDITACVVGQRSPGGDAVATLIADVRDLLLDGEARVAREAARRRS